MTDFITLTCPSCGSKLQLTNDIDRFACSSCGNEHIVIRSGGIVSLSPVAEHLKGIKVGVDKTASELAIPRLQGEITQLKKDIPKVHWQIIKNLRNETDKGTFLSHKPDATFRYCYGRLHNIDFKRINTSNIIDNLSIEGLKLLYDYYFDNDPNELFHGSLAAPFIKSFLELREILKQVNIIKALEENISEKQIELAKHQEIVKR
jgi:hypothetical protein